MKNTIHKDNEVRGFLNIGLTDDGVIALQLDDDVGGTTGELQRIVTEEEIQQINKIIKGMTTRLVVLRLTRDVGDNPDNEKGVEF